jgi:excisionase family DNA binding protein
MKKVKTRTPARFMRVKEYADHVGVHERTIRTWIYDGVIPTIRS